MRIEALDLWQLLRDQVPDLQPVFLNFMRDVVEVDAPPASWFVRIRPAEGGLVVEFKGLRREDFAGPLQKHVASVDEAGVVVSVRTLHALPSFRRPLLAAYARELVRFEREEGPFSRGEVA